MSLTFLPKSSAYSWKMSFEGHVLCQRMLIGPCALHDVRRSHGRAAVAPAASRNLRRVAVLDVGFFSWSRPSLGRFWGCADRCPVAHSLTCSGRPYSAGLSDTFTGLALFHKPVTSPWASLQALDPAYFARHRRGRIAAVLAAGPRSARHARCRPHRRTIRERPCLRRSPPSGGLPRLISTPKTAGPDGYCWPP